MGPDGPKWGEDDFFLLIQTLPTFWAERILILRIFIFLDFLDFLGSQLGPGLGPAWAQLGVGPGLGPGLGPGWGPGLGPDAAAAGAGAAGRILRSHPDPFCYPSGCNGDYGIFSHFPLCFDVF